MMVKRQENKESGGIGVKIKPITMTWTGNFDTKSDSRTINRLVKL